VIAALSFLWWMLFFFLWVAFLTLTMTIARSKGHSPLPWGLLACVLPGITVIIVLLLPVRSQAARPT
jgi:phosphate starvation-inducible membrane PsiE